MCEHIRCHVQTRTVFTLDYRSFTAYHLYGIEKTVPDTYTRKSERTPESTLHRNIHLFADNERDKSRNKSCHRHDLPVIPENEHAKQLAKIYESLPYPACMPYSSIHQTSPPAASAEYFLTNSSALPSPPSSLRLTDMSISSIDFLPKNMRAS